MSYYVARDGESFGPYTELQMREYLSTGVFTAEELGCREGVENWLPLRELLPERKPRVLVQTPAPVPSPVIKETARPVAAKPRSNAKWLVLAIIVAGVAAWWFLALRPAEIHGQVFIVTRGGTNYRLGLVPVNVYDADDAGPRLTEAMKKGNARLDVLKQTLEAEQGTYNHSDAYYAADSEEDAILEGKNAYQVLGQPIANTQTDADGNFTVTVPRQGKFVIAAKGQRLAGESTEHYYWILTRSFQDLGGGSLMLSNNNTYPSP